MSKSDSENLESQPPANGESLTIEQAIANLRGNDQGSRYYAAWWLGRFRVKEEAAITALIWALDDECDRTPDGGYRLRRNAARALGKLGDARGVPALINCLDCSDYYVRESAAESLGVLDGNRESIPKLMQMLQVKTGESENKNNQPFAAIIEALGNLGTTEAIESIKPFLEYSVDLVRYSALRALYQLTQESRYGDELVKALDGDNLQLRRSALADLGAIGYLPAAEPNSETLAENSLKIISLKGILEHHLEKPLDGEEPNLSDVRIRVMKLLDGLL
ncbi:MAG: HEAT repeat domain-containing protein [Rivularia sp. ALOHA_DT_140]|nr:HEAT repeat domain-containing protein [Rivularia sp. ALOHA_DT_140]